MKHEFCDHCPGCRPAIIDMKTGKPLPPDSPLMVAVDRMWNTETTYAERKAFIEVTLHNSRKPEDIELARKIMARIETETIYFAHMAVGADGNKVTNIPKGFVSGGPCPNCKNMVDPNPKGFTFGTGPEDDMAPDTQRAGVVVCRHCATPLWFDKPGEYRTIPRKMLRELPRVTQKFIRREQEIIASIKRQIN